jgi:hypothetical protein
MCLHSLLIYYSLEISETTKVEKAEEDTSVKFEEEDTVIGGCEDVEIKQEDVELDGTRYVIVRISVAYTHGLFSVHVLMASYSALRYHAFTFPRLLATQTLTPGTSCSQRCVLGAILSGHSLHRRSQNEWRT